MKNLNKFLIYKSKSFTQLEINQTNQIFYDRIFQFLAGQAFTKYDLHDVMNHRLACIDASVYIFSNLNLFLNVARKKAFCFKHRYKYTYHDYYITKSQFVEHYGKRK